MPGTKTNERPGTRAVLRYGRLSAYKVRQVLDLIRGQDVDRAAEILATCDREAATVVGKLLTSAVANAAHNDQLDAEDLYVSACYADEGSTLKRWRPRARGRATRIRKRTAHVTIIVSRMPDERIARRRARQAATSSQRSRRVAGSRRRQARAEASAQGADAARTDDGVGASGTAEEDWVDGDDEVDGTEDGAEEVGTGVEEVEDDVEDAEPEDADEEDADISAEDEGDSDDEVDDEVDNEVDDEDEGAIEASADDEEDS